MIAHAESLGEQWLGEFCHTFFICSQRNRNALSVQGVLETHYLALHIKPAALDDVERFVQDDFLTLA